MPQVERTDVLVCDEKAIYTVGGLLSRIAGMGYQLRGPFWMARRSQQAPRSRALAHGNSAIAPRVDRGPPQTLCVPTKAVRVLAFLQTVSLAPRSSVTPALGNVGAETVDIKKV